jgi:hypothetical protein
MPFVPQDLVPVAVGKTTVNLYPRLTPETTTEERAHAHHVNVTALTNAELQPDVFLDTFGLQMSASTIVDGHKHDFKRYFKNHWVDFGNLRILSFHNSNGAIIADTVTAADNQILKPVQDGNIPNCRNADVRYVRVKCELDFIALCIGHTPGDPTVLHQQYYIELPQETHQVLDGHGAPRQLTTFHGPDDLRTLTVDQVHNTIIALVPQDGPIDLTEAAFNLATATIDDELIVTRINKTIFRIARLPILKSVFNQMCPDFTNLPQKAVEDLHQCYTGPDGNPISYTIAQFSAIFNAALRPMVDLEEYPIDVVSLFINRLHPDVYAALKDLYPQHSAPHNRGGTAQRAALAEVIRLATRAERNVLNVRNIVSNQMGQSYHTNVASYPSQAEKTLARYNVGGNDKGGKEAPHSGSPERRRSSPNGPYLTLLPRQRCHGCESTDHPWSTCPHRNDPEAVKRAKKNSFEFRKKKFSAMGRGADRRYANAKGAPNLTDLSDKGQEKIKRQVLAAVGIEADDVTANTTTTVAAPSTPTSTSLVIGRGRGRGSTFNGPIVMLQDVVVLSSATKPNLPVPIQSNLPHIRFRIGEDDGTNPVIEMPCTLDSAASLSTGSLPYLSKLAIEAPWTVHSVLTAKHYSPLVLSGVVQQDGAPVTTELPCAFIFKTPYKTHDGQPVTIIIAAGPHVNVNCILGMPFLQATQMIMDFKDNVAECSSLACPPFPIIHKRASLTLPALRDTGKVDANAYEPYGSFIAAVEKMTAEVLAAYKAPPLSPTKRIRFNLEDGTSTIISQNVLADYLSRLNAINATSGDQSLPVIREGLYDDLDVLIGNHTADEDDE